MDGYDYRFLAEQLGCDRIAIDHLGGPILKGGKSPTQVLVSEKNVTPLQLRDNFKDKRQDVVDETDAFIRQQGCNCSKCSSLM